MRLLQVCVVWGVVVALVCVLGLMVFGYCAGVCCDWFVWICLGFRLLLGVVALLFVLYWSRCLVCVLLGGVFVWFVFVGCSLQLALFVVCLPACLVSLVYCLR